MKRKTGNFGLSLSLDATNSVTFSRPCVAHVEQISSQRVPFHSPPSRFEISTISCLYRQFCFSDPFTAKSYLAVQGSRPLPPAVGVRFDGKLQTFSFFGFLQRQKTISRFVFFSLLAISCLVFPPLKIVLYFLFLSIFRHNYQVMIYVR